MLVEEYETLTTLRHKHRGIQVRLMDVDVALRKLTKVYREAVFLCGLAGLTSRAAGILVGVGKSTMHRRYIKGMDILYEIINTGGHHS